MCGIAGLILFPITRPSNSVLPGGRSLIPDSWVTSLDAAIAHRGPDGAGVVHQRGEAEVVLLHRRLSIIDVAGGAQPMLRHEGGRVSGPEGRADSADLALVFNGCIYNHRELRRELEGRGHQFTSSHSDTEVLLHGFAQWGDSLWDKVEGMFAVAIWNARTQTLVLARDRFGEKPLYYVAISTIREGVPCTGYAFASTAAALLPFAAREDSGLDEWVRFGFAPHPPRCSVRGVAPASALSLSRDSQTLRDHWFCMEGPSRTFPIRDEPLDPETLTRLVTRAVERRLEADVPLGCFLSGGVDSSLVAAIAHRALGSLSTFTVKMPDPEYDESRFAAQVATAIGTKHQTLECNARPAEDLMHLITQCGLPLGDSSLLPTHWVSRAARQHVKVALSGDGGDELFCGYERYRAADMLAGPMRRLLAFVPGAMLPRHNPKAFTTKLARLVSAATGDGYLDLISVFPFWHFVRLMGHTEQPREARWPWHGAGNAMAWDTANYLPDDLLRKSDTALKACALEVRAPLLDRALSTAALSAPLGTLCPKRQLKGLLRGVAGSLVRPELLDRPKMGFAIPIGRWFKEDFGGLGTLLRDHLSGTEPFGSPGLGIEISSKATNRLMSDHFSGRADHSQRLYLLLVLSIWAKRCGTGIGSMLTRG